MSGLILIACEESQAVCTAFRERGHEAYSCDIRPCSGGHPEWHIQGDALEALEGQKWDIVIAHPPCTYLSNAGAIRLHLNGGMEIDEERYEKLQEARRFFNRFLYYEGAMVCVENPTPLKAAALPKPSQIIQPSMFGEPYSKRTCLWLRGGLPPLMATELVMDTKSWTFENRDPKVRSKTFPGIANAMAEQWGQLLEEKAR